MLLCIDKKTFITNIFVFFEILFSLGYARIHVSGAYTTGFSKTTWISHCQPWAEIMLGTKFPEFEVTTGRGRLPPFPPPDSYLSVSLLVTAAVMIFSMVARVTSLRQCRQDNLLQKFWPRLTSVKSHRILPTRRGYCLQNANNEQKSRYCL